MKKLKLFFACLLMAVLSIGQMWGSIDANSTWTATAFGDIPDGATVVIINNFGNSFANATVTKAPAKVAASFNSTTKKITVSTTGKSLDDIAWTVEKATNGTKFWVYGSTTNLLGVTKDGDNNAVGVGSTTNVPNNELVLSGLLKPYNLTRFIGEYVSGSDWRSYNSATANNYKSGSTTQSLTFYVLDAAPTDPFTVTLMDNSATLTEESAGAGVTLPSRDGCEGYTFVGWTNTWTAAQSSWTTEAPEIIPAGAYHPTADENLYPVYTKVEVSSGSGFTGYTQIAFGETITDGQYLISTGSFTMAGSGKTGASFTPGSTEKTEYEYTISVDGDYFTILGPDNNYIGSGSGTGLTFANAVSDDTYRWKYVSTGIINKSNTTRHIKGYNTTDFRNYTTSNGTLTYLYKRTEGGSSSTTYYISEPSCCTKRAISIASGITNGSISADFAEACEGVTVTITFSPDGGYHLESWSVNGTAQNVNANTFLMPAAAATVSATFAHDDCANLAAPTLDEITKSYNSATIAWNEVADAEEYAVSVVNHATSASIFAGNVDALSKALADLEPETQYDYSIMAVGDGSVKCADGNGVLEGNFTTESLPTAHLTLIDPSGTHASSGNYAILTPFNLPSTAAACSKEFRGWDSDENCATAPTYAKGAEFTFANTTSVTLYAVYADELTPGTTSYVKTALADIASGSEVVVTEKKSDDMWALSYNPSTSKTVAAAVSEDENILDVSSLTNGFWTLTKDGDNFTLTVVGGTDKLYCNNTNDGVRVGSGDANTFSINNNYLYTSATSDARYLGVYSGTEFRCYTSINTNISGQTLAFYKKVTSEGTYGNYSTICVAAPTAEPASASIAVAAAGGEGTLGVSYENVNLAGVEVALFNDAACTIAFDGGWLTATIEGDDKHIAYTIAENTAYAARTAYIKLTAPETNGAANPAVVVIPVEQAKKPAVFASLEDLVAAELASGTEVTVSFSNVMITEVYKTNAGYRYGLYLNVKDKDGENDIELFYNKQEDSEQVPDTWVKNGYVSATNLVTTWTEYKGQWELAMQGATWSWENGDITYGAPKAVSSVVVSGEPAKKAYVDGEKFNPAGLTVTVNYTVGDPEVIAVTDADWEFTPERLAKGETGISVKATYNTVQSAAFNVTGLTVGDIQLKTVEEFIAAGNADMRCYLEGIVSDIETGSKLKYGNFNLTDASGTIYVYGCLNQDGVAQKFDELGVANGDKIKVIAEDYDYYNSKHEAKNVQFVSKTSPVDITITSGSTVEKGKTLTLTATTDPAAAIDHISYSVKVDGNEGNVSLSDNVLTGVEVGEATIIASIPDGEGYIANSVEFTVEVTQAIVHASITYVENGANEDIDDVADATALPDPLPTVTKDNFLFGGWYTDAEFNTPAVAGAALSEDVTLYAKWNAIPPYALVYTSNVAFVGGGDYYESSSKVSINSVQYDAQKVGSSSATGTITITVPAYTHTLHFHVFTWNNQTVTLNVTSDDVTNLSVSEIAVDGDPAGSGSKTYTINSNPVNHYQYITFDPIATEAQITFSRKEGDKRFIMYGINQEGGVLPVLDHIVITGNASATEYEAGDVFSLVGLGVDAYYTLDNDPIEEPTHLDVDENWSGWSVSPAILTAETESVTVTATYEGKQANKNVNVNVTAPETPEIIASPAAINFGTVNQGAIVDAQGISVTLKAVAAATVTLDGAGFTIDKAALSELNSTVTVTPVTTATGTFAATVTISDDADAADDVVINLSMTVEAVEDLSGTWVKATSVAAGDRIIIGATYQGVTKTMGAQNPNNRAAVESTFEDLVLTPAEGTKTFLVVDAGDGKFALQALNGKYLTSATSGTGNNLLEAANYENDNAKWTITIDGEGVASVVAAAGSRTYMKYNNGSTLFSCYQYETSQSPINIYKKGTPDYGSYQRNGLTAGDYGTICLPKAGVIEGATLFEIGSYENNIIYVDEVIGSVMEAGKPYIFQATADQLNVTYTSGTQVAASDANGLHGYYDLDNMATDEAAQKNLDQNDGNYILYQNAYWLVSGRAAYINNFRAYIKIGEIQNTPAPEPTPGQAPRRRVAMSVHGTQTATGMENVQGDNVQCTKVLIDGQLFIIRGEQMFDVKGQLVK